MAMSKSGNAALKRIVVVGGGAGGLELVTKLGRTIGRKKVARPFLVDTHSTHIWKPLLHEAATGAFNIGEDEINYFAHAYQFNYEFKQGAMMGLDMKNKTIRIASIKDDNGRIISPERDCRYDTLVMACGAVTNSFGTPGAEKCYQLNTHHQAESLRRALLLEALAVAMGTSRSDKLRIGIVGGGATGVELAAEMHHTITELRHMGSNLSRDQLEITILEGAPRVLGNAPELSEYATKSLTRRGIKVKLNCGVKEITDTAFILKDGTTLESDIKIWTAGVKGADWLKTIGLKVNRINQIETNINLQSVTDPSIFAMGDCSFVPDRGNEGKFCPSSAQVAHQEADWMAKKLCAIYLPGAKDPQPFLYNAKGMIVSLGYTKAVGSVSATTQKRLYIEGRMAKIMYSLLYRMHQAAVHGWPRTLVVWTADKLRQQALPQVKLH